MSDFEEYPIVTKTQHVMDIDYSITVANMRKVNAAFLSAWQVVSAANYAVGKELRIAVRDCHVYQKGEHLFNEVYDGYQQCKAIVEIPVTLGWPALRAELDIRIMRFRLDGPPQHAELIKQQMIADMIYLYMYPDEVVTFPLNVELKQADLVNQFIYTKRRRTFLSHPDLFTFTTNSPIIS